MPRRFASRMLRPLVLAFLAAAALGHAAGPAASPTERRFAGLRKSPLELYAFLYRMPKGADLHNHLSGAIYAESFLKAAVEQHLCIDKAALALTPQCGSGLVRADAIETDGSLRNALIDSFSMRNFVAGKESAHDHFFATFGKFGAVSSDAGSEAAQRAADQNESYIELMALSGGGPIAALGKTVGLTADFDAVKKKLDAAGLPQQVAALRARVDQMEQTRMSKLGCAQSPDSAACRLQIRYVYQVQRESPKEQIFAQVMGGFALASSDPRVVAVNFVQAEDGYNSMNDYHLQMTMVDYAKRIYPNVHITLHAGELAPRLVPPDGLRFPYPGGGNRTRTHAERIGHGVDVMYENDPVGLLAEMRDRHIAVEINLTSNDIILGVRGPEHPFPVYRMHGVPAVLSTDDEGVSRSQLTEEFQRAVLTYNLSYADLKELVRNSIEYSFAPGLSYWKDRAYKTIAPSCAGGRKTPACREYLGKNEKARLGADLEDRFAAFERN